MPPGWPLVIVETVGVGQIEIEVAATCDTVVVVVNPGWGDSVQANKAGLLEVADVLVINKADRPGVSETARDLKMMLELSGPLEWTPPIVETVAPSAKGVAELFEAIASHREYLSEHGELATTAIGTGEGRDLEDRAGSLRGCPRRRPLPGPRERACWQRSRASRSTPRRRPQSWSGRSPREPQRRLRAAPGLSARSITTKSRP